MNWCSGTCSSRSSTCKDLSRIWANKVRSESIVGNLNVRYSCSKLNSQSSNRRGWIRDNSLSTLNLNLCSPTRKWCPWQARSRRCQNNLFREIRLWTFLMLSIRSPLNQWTTQWTTQDLSFLNRTNFSKHHRTSQQYQIRQSIWTWLTNAISRDLQGLRRMILTVARSNNNPSRIWLNWTRCCLTF